MWTRNYGALGQTARVCFGVLCANRKKEEVKRDFGDLRIRRSEGRVVNTPLVLKKGSFSGDKETGEKKRGNEKKKRKELEKDEGCSFEEAERRIPEFCSVMLTRNPKRE
ncbi:hypothetical protein TNCV_4098261 [Trichonephila clavipes]|nr:hypothetical protein TNCV_4098261 [Trichonephila clavipes]